MRFARPPDLKSPTSNNTFRNQHFSRRNLPLERLHRHPPDLLRVPLLQRIDERQVRRRGGADGHGATRDGDDGSCTCRTPCGTRKGRMAARAAIESEYVALDRLRPVYRADGPLAWWRIFAGVQPYRNRDPPPPSDGGCDAHGNGNSNPVAPAHSVPSSAERMPVTAVALSSVCVPLDGPAGVMVTWTMIPPSTTADAAWYTDPLAGSLTVIDDGRTPRRRCRTRRTRAAGSRPPPETTPTPAPAPPGARAAAAKSDARRNAARDSVGELG